MNKNSIKVSLIKIIKDRYKATTSEEPDIDGNTKPFDQLDLFDSLLLSEVGIDIEEELGIDFKNTKKAFEEANGLKGITLNQMVDLIYQANIK